MTLRYSDINQHDALYRSACKYPGGIEALGLRMETSPNVLRNKLQPSCQTHHANFEDVSEVIELLVEVKSPLAYKALHAFNARHGHAAYKIPEGNHDADDLLAQLVAVMGEQGHLADSISDVLSDKRIDETEFERVELRIQSCLSALASLKEKVKMKHEADFHK